MKQKNQKQKGNKLKGTLHLKYYVIYPYYNIFKL